MSNENTNVLSRVLSRVGSLGRYSISVTVNFELNPFAWSIGDAGAKKNIDDRGVWLVYLSVLPLKLIFDISRRGNK